LEKHAGASEVWVGYFKKSSGQASLTWSASVDAALCFGWIDGIRKTVDEQSYKMHFTPRKATSIWSAVSIKKVKALIKHGKMRPAGLHLFTIEVISTAMPLRTEMNRLPRNTISTSIFNNTQVDLKAIKRSVFILRLRLYEIQHPLLGLRPPFRRNRFSTKDLL